MTLLADDIAYLTANAQSWTTATQAPVPESLEGFDGERNDGEPWSAFKLSSAWVPGESADSIRSAASLCYGTVSPSERVTHTVYGRDAAAVIHELANFLRSRNS